MYAPSPANLAQQFQPVATQNGGVTGSKPYFANAIKSTVVTVSAVPAILKLLGLINTDAAPVFLQFFDLPTAPAITLGTTTPTFVIPYSCNATAANGVSDRAQTMDIQFLYSIRCAATTTASGNTASTNGLTGTIGYVTT